MRVAMHLAILCIGAFLVMQAGVGLTRPVAVWSGFTAFSARVADDEAGRHVLAYGGEEEGTDFDDLLDRLGRLSDDWSRVFGAGTVLCLLGAAGIVMEALQGRSRQEKTAESGGNSEREEMKSENRKY